METMKKNNQAYTATCHSPFADVYKYQSVNGDNEKKPISRTRLHAHSPFAEVYK